MTLESLEFPRWDVKYGDEKKGEPRNIWYDKIAHKIGLGENLRDSDQEVKPRVKEIAVKTNLAKTFSSYLWAAVGVGLALQKSWDNYFNVATCKFWKPKPFMHSILKFGEAFYDSAKELYNGPENKKGFFTKHSGKLLIGAAALSTILGLSNVLISKNKPSKLDSDDIIDKEGKFVVN